MIPRYSRPEMAALFDDQAKFGSWLEVEILACEAWAELGVIPRADAVAIRERAGFDVVIGDLLALVHRGDVDARALAYGARRVGGHDAELRPRLDREHLDLEPRTEARLVGEEVGDLGE